MARLFSLPVMGGGALIASPALHSALVAGTMPLETAAVRLLAAIVFLWLGLTLIGSLVEGTSAPPGPVEDQVGQSGAPPVRAAVVDQPGAR